MPKASFLSLKISKVQKFVNQPTQPLGFQCLVLEAIVQPHLGQKRTFTNSCGPTAIWGLSNLSFPALVTPENNHSYQKLFPSLEKWQMNEVKYYFLISYHLTLEKRNLSTHFHHVVRNQKNLMEDSRKQSVV